MAFEELKQKHGLIWGSGPYQNVTDTIADIHERVVERLGPSAAHTREYLLVLGTRR